MLEPGSTWLGTLARNTPPHLKYSPVCRSCAIKIDNGLGSCATGFGKSLPRPMDMPAIFCEADQPDERGGQKRNA